MSDQPIGTIAADVKRYVELRDQRRRMKREYTALDQPLAEEEGLLGGKILAYMNELGTEGCRTAYGTCYKSERATASLADPDAFMRFVTENQRFELLDRKANVTAVKDYIQKNNAPPPGVNLHIMQTLGVQRAGQAIGADSE